MTFVAAGSVKPSSSISFVTDASRSSKLRDSSVSARFVEIHLRASVFDVVGDHRNARDGDSLDAQTAVGFV